MLFRYPTIDIATRPLVTDPTLPIQEEHLNDPPPPTLVSLLTTLQRTSTSLHLLSLSLLTPTPTDQAQTSLQHLSLSTGLATLLRGTPHHLGAHRKLPGVPLDLLASAGVRMEGLLRGEEEDRAKLRDAVWEVAVRANDEMLTARMEWKDTGGKVPREIMPAFLGAVSSRRPTFLYPFQRELTLSCANTRCLFTPTDPNSFISQSTREDRRRRPRPNACDAPLATPNRHLVGELEEKFLDRSLGEEGLQTVCERGRTRSQSPLLVVCYPCALI